MIFNCSIMITKRKKH